MSNVLRVAQLRQQIIAALPDKDREAFDEYNELVVKMIEDLRKLNEKQNRVLQSFVKQSEN